MCRIPVTATMQKQPDGTYKMINAEYEDIPADLIAQKLITAFGGIPKLKNEAVKP